MYLYDEIDQRLVDERVAQFRDQTRRFLAGKLSEDEFRPLRLRNGLYIQRYAPMLRVAIPYGLLVVAPAAQARAHRAHVRPRLRPLHHAPEPPVQLAAARGRAGDPRRARHGRRCTPSRRAATASATSPPTISPASRRTRSSIPFVWCEIAAPVVDVPPGVRLPAAQVQDRGQRRDARTAPRSSVHDIGLHAVRDSEARRRSASACIVGGGLGRTPIVGHVIREFLPWQHLLTYLEAILRVYNRYGRRDNIHKARIKILVKERTPEAFREEVEAEWAHLKDGPATLTRRKSRASQAASRARSTSSSPATISAARAARGRAALRRLGEAQRASAQGAGLRGGDAVAQEDRRAAGRRDRRPDGRGRRPRRPLQLRRAARLARAEPDSRRRAPVATCTRCGGEAQALGLATPNIGLLTNIIACPGGDFCSLANAKSIPVARGDPASASTTSTTSTTSASSTSTSPAA